MEVYNYPEQQTFALSQKDFDYEYPEEEYYDPSEDDGSPFGTKKKTRRSRRGGYRRKRQQQKKVAELIAASNAARAAAAAEAAGDNTKEPMLKVLDKVPSDSSSTATAETETESESSSSCESSTATAEENESSPPATPTKPVARRRGAPHQASSPPYSRYPAYNHYNPRSPPPPPSPYGPMSYPGFMPMPHGYPGAYPPHPNPMMMYHPHPHHPVHYAPPIRKSVRPKEQVQVYQGGLSTVDLNEEQQQRYVALDCEMVGIGPNGEESALARVTLIDWNGGVLMDEYIKPHKKVTDYRTFVSGITPDMLQNAKMDFATCRRRVIQLLRGKVLVGHALKNDLGILRISHPWFLIRDTARYEPFMKVRFQDGLLWPRSLRDLCKSILNRDVQVYGRPHCSYEDALAALDLYRTVRVRWEKSMEYKTNKTMAIQQRQLLQYTPATKGSSKKTSVRA